MKIRLATIKDAQEIHDLHSESARQLCTQYSSVVINGWLKGRTPEGYYEGILRGEMYICENDVQICGFSHVIPGEIVALFVKPNMARKGIGTLLANHGLSFARKTWVGPIKLEATLNAVPFYESVGFKTTGQCVTRRNNVEIPIVLMELI